MKTPCLAALAAALAPSLAFAQIASDDFEVGNTHQWAVDFALPATHFTTGGNPGGRISVAIQSSQSTLPAAMVVPTQAGHPWAGDFRALGVTTFIFDRQVELGAANFGTRPYLVLGDDSGTPGNPTDDALAFVPTGDVFQFGAVPWETFTVSIPSASTVLDAVAGWDADAFPGSPLAGQAPDVIWDTIIQDVDYVGIAMDRPLGGFFWFGSHIINFDNFQLEGAAGPISGLNFCGPNLPNTTGVPGAISATGSIVASANNLTLRAENLPPGQFGIFIASQTDGFVPGPSFNSNGNLCLGGSIGRFVGPGQILSADAAGSFALQVDLTTIPQGSTFVPVMGGETWHFQAWHRDTVGFGQNFTDGLRIPFI